MDNVEKYLEDFRSLLNQEIEVSAEAIRTLTGPITIKQEAIPGRKNGATWIASFQPDLLSFLRLISAENNYPDSITLEYLKTRNWITPRDCEVRIEKIPRYEELADMLLEMHENGSSIQTIASAYNMSWEYANQIVKFAKIGERPKWKAGKRTGKGSKTPKCIEIKAEVDRRRIQKHSFKKIARDLGVSQSTVVRAYDLSHSEEVLEAAKKGETPDRGKYQHISETTKQKIRRLIEEGKKSVREIALELSCSENTVRRER